MFKQLSIIALFVLVLFSCNGKQEIQNKPVQIAFMADVHLQDIYGEFQDSDYRGVMNPKTREYTIARTMKSQLQSTRIFNENYFAFIAALDDVVKRGIKYVVLPGDFSDDGQLLNIRGLKRILDEYSKKYDINFIATTGNHDPVRPFYQDAGKKDFLGVEGKPQPVFSKADMYVPKDSLELPVVITKDIAKLGYNQILKELNDFGFSPKETDVYWETPFTSYSYTDYSFKEALNQSYLSERNYEIPPYKTLMPDVSYLVEPSEDLWFLAIDANVYTPKENSKSDGLNPSNYNSASVGYNNVLTHKKHLLSWVASVAKRAEQLGKTLITFSHYPMVDFNDDASMEMSLLFGKNKMQLHRIPNEDVARAFAEAGVKIHFGGHMHINDTGVRTFEQGNALFNIQIPSLAAYIPAYKLLSIHSSTTFEVETVVIDSVPGFNDLFLLYESEYQHLQKIKDTTLWNKEILKSKTYKEFTQWHLKELVRLRFLPNDWPSEFKEFMLNSTGQDILRYATKDEVGSPEFKQWTGFDMIFDFYRLRSADELAIPDIGLERLEQYKAVCNKLKKSDYKQFALWGELFSKAANGQPSNHFKINLKSNSIKRISAK